MCGIVGILGREPVAAQLVDALKRLEYRGYDSAGVATLEQGKLVRLRAQGKLKALETRLDRLRSSTGSGASVEHHFFIHRTLVAERPLHRRPAPLGPSPRSLR